MGCKCAFSGPEMEAEIHKNFESGLNNNNNFINKDQQFRSNNNPFTPHQINLNNSNNNNSNQDNSFKFNSLSSSSQANNDKYLDYPQKIVDIINIIREDPASYSEVVEDAISNISERTDIRDSTKNNIIFKKKVKVALNRGEPAFREAIEKLKEMDPMPQLIFDNELCLELPETEEELKDPKFLKSRVNLLREKGKEVNVFFKDLVKLPEVSGLLMVVDDNGKNAGKKRDAILNPELRYIGVSCKFIGQMFVAYFALSK